MNSDDFEKRLQRQPLRRVPPDWREKILKEASSSRHPSFVIRHSLLSTINSGLSTLLWPNPKAWAGLGAVWVLIFALHFASRENSQVLATAPASKNAGFFMTLKDEQRTLVELMGNNQPGDAEQSRPSGSKPRSERRSATMAA
jgi:hypothetical protein